MFTYEICGWWLRLVCNINSYSGPLGSAGSGSDDPNPAPMSRGYVHLMKEFSSIRRPLPNNIICYWSKQAGPRPVYTNPTNSERNLHWHQPQTCSQERALPLNFYCSTIYSVFVFQSLRDVQTSSSAAQ
jgi:hypothetical protein